MAALALLASAAYLLAPAAGGAAPSPWVERRATLFTAAWAVMASAARNPAAATAPRPAAAGLASTPPMGFNTWNHFKCGVDAQVLMGVADRFLSLGLAGAGYEYVNRPLSGLPAVAGSAPCARHTVCTRSAAFLSDDCWMGLARSPSANGTAGAGPQVPNASKFPQGMRAVADYIHSKGLKIGLYTARAPLTCAKFAGSCHHERVDVVQWANWTIVSGVLHARGCTAPSPSPLPRLDYMKDDSCGSCEDVVSDYTTMQAAIRDVGRPMVLTIEGLPPIEQGHAGAVARWCDASSCALDSTKLNTAHAIHLALRPGEPCTAAVPGSIVYTGHAGNARRVGHDITPTWTSMISLLDLGAGLWPYAHNGRQALRGQLHLSKAEGGGGFWNDLDMLEVGNGDFAASAGPLAAANARTHFSMWAVMKAVLLLGCDLSSVDAASLAIVKNPQAVAINQDAWGQQARRIATLLPQNSTLAFPDPSLALAA
eukprot:gene2476-3232_t